MISLGTEITKELLFPKKRPAPSCSLHEGKRLKLYCSSCEYLVCQGCTTTNAHKDHIKSIEMPQIKASSEREKIRKWITPVQTKMQELNTAVDVNKQVLQQVEASKEKAAEAIRQAFEKLHSILEEREKQLQSELHDLILRKTTSLVCKKKSLKK